MSYARMSGEYSDIYLFGTWHQNSQTKGLSSRDLPIVYECMSCKLEDKRQSQTMMLRFIPDYYMFNLKAVYRHLRHHHYAHHKIPHYTWRRVLMEYWDIPIDRMLELSADYASLRE